MLPTRDSDISGHPLGQNALLPKIIDISRNYSPDLMPPIHVICDHVLHMIKMVGTGDYGIIINTATEHGTNVARAESVNEHSEICPLSMFLK
jgi:hypothetical protein